MHIVDELIEERAPRLVARPHLFRAIRPILYRLLAYDDAVTLVDNISPLTGQEAFSYVSAHLNPQTDIDHLSQLPSTGRCVVIANHPTGLADGLAVFHAIRERRPDHVFLANADALRVIPNCGDIVIPVEWVKSKRTHTKARDTLLAVKAALEEERCVVIFPSGALARMSWCGLEDRPWQSSAAMLARKYKAPIIPLRIKARNSSLYYCLEKLSGELRDITLFNELLNKKGQRFKMTFGNPIQPEDIPKNADEATAEIRKIVEGL